ncbi:hypothetical protein ACIQ9P_21400 [Kitasatospora sp. NPDC094019]|uniref:hypothetical protein n=1 Tax=Kitasatospora sp. NPDC094019 TaxID=3364091 RepID=UPI00382816EB
MTKVRTVGAPSDVALLPLAAHRGEAERAPAENARIESRHLRRQRPFAGYAFALSALVVTVWAVTLGVHAEPDRRALWVGFDALEAAAMALASRLALRRDARVGLAAAGIAVFMVSDLWFDVGTASSDQLPMALLTAVTLELPFAAGCVAYALRVHHRAAA